MEGVSINKPCYLKDIDNIEVKQLQDEYLSWRERTVYIPQLQTSFYCKQQIEESLDDQPSIFRNLALHQ